MGVYGILERLLSSPQDGMTVEPVKDLNRFFEVLKDFVKHFTSLHFNFIIWQPGIIWIGACASKMPLRSFHQFFSISSVGKLMAALALDHPISTDLQVQSW